MAKDPICEMQVDEKKSIKLAHNKQTYFFCSSHCLEKFAKEKGISRKQLTSCLIQQKASFYKNKSFIAASALVILVILSYFISFLEPFRVSLWMYFGKIWWAVLLGFFLGGVIDYYVPREYVSHILSKPKRHTIFYSVILGFFMSACSHGILALSIELHKKGASNPAVVAFLLSSPWANMALTIMLIGFFGLKALLIILSAIIIAIITGLVFQLLERYNLIEKNHNIIETKDTFSVASDIKKRLRGYKFSIENLKSDIKGIYKGAISLSNMVLWWILIGMGLASLAGAYIPSGVFHNYMGPTLFGLIVVLIVATIIEVCSEGSAPLAFEIFKQTGAFGNSFVFLMAGVVTDYTEIGLLWHNVGKRVAIWLPIITVPQVILLGFLFNILI